jgi:hypothetical protein
MIRVQIRDAFHWIEERLIFLSNIMTFLIGLLLLIRELDYTL